MKNEMRFKAPIVSMMHDMGLTEKHIVFSDGRLRHEHGAAQGQQGPLGMGSSVPGVCRHPAARWRRQGRPLVQDAADARRSTSSAARTVGNKVTIEAPALRSAIRSRSSRRNGRLALDPHEDDLLLRRWTFDLDSKKDGLGRDIVSRTRRRRPWRDRRALYWSRPIATMFMGYTDPSRPFDEARGGNLRGRVTNCYARFDFANNKMDSLLRRRRRLACRNAVRAARRRMHRKARVGSSASPRTMPRCIPS